MNTINIDQNKVKYLRLHYLANHFYNLTNIIYAFSWTCAILSILLAAYSTQISLKFDIIPIISIILAVFVLTLDKIVLVRIINIASASRITIDNNLFDLHITDKINGYSEKDLKDLSIKVINKNQKKAELLMNNTGLQKPRGFKDWYTNIDESEEQLEAIYKCQSQNIYWDEHLSKVQIWVYNFLISLFFLSLICIFYNNSVKEMLYFLSSLIPLLINIITEYISVKNYKQTSHALQIKFKERPSQLNIEYIMQLQERINERRCLNFISFDFLHKLYSNKLHTLISNLINSQD